MPIIDTWCEYSQSKSLPMVDESWSYEHRADQQIQSNDKPRYCKKCGHKLSRYNTSKYCWSGSCQPKDEKPKRVQRHVVSRKAKYCQMCGNEIVRGKYCGQCHNMFAARRRSWRRKYPGVAIPDAFLFRKRGDSNCAGDYL